MANISLYGGGHGKKRPQEQAPSGPSLGHVILKRQWRLGDIIMCEPAARIWVARNHDVTFCTRNIYHPIIHAFPEGPPKVMSHPPPDEGVIELSGEVKDLDIVSLLHEGHVTKVDAFLSAADIPPEDLSPDEKRPRLKLHPRYRAWAATRLEAQGLTDAPLVAIVRQSYDAQCARNLPIDIQEQVMIELSRHCKVLCIGANPARIPEGKGEIYNLTGTTPDVAFAGGILEHCRVLVTVDTGLLHLGGALGVPMVTIMGPTSPEDLALIYQRNSVLDYGGGCSRCYEQGCDDPCLSHVDPKDVVSYTLARMEAPDAPTETIRMAI